MPRREPGPGDVLTLRGAFPHTPGAVRRAALAFLASAFPCERLVTHQVGLEAVAGLLADRLAIS